MSWRSFSSWVDPLLWSREFKELPLDRKEDFERSVSNKPPNRWTCYKCDELINERSRHKTLSCQPGEFSMTHSSRFTCGCSALLCLLSSLTQNTGDRGHNEISASQKQVDRVGTWSVSLWYKDTHWYTGLFLLPKLLSSCTCWIYQTLWDMAPKKLVWDCRTIYYNYTRIIHTFTLQTEYIQN